MPKRTPPKLKGSDGKPFIITINEFKGGTMTLLDESRIPNTGVAVSNNLMLDQDGVWRVRDGTAAYGKTLTGPIDGISDTVVKYNADGSSTTYLFCVDNGALKYSQNGGNWTTISGKTWTTGHPVQFTQIASKLFITNGYDKLSYCDLSSFTIVTYTALGAAPTPTVSAYNTLTSTANYYVYYSITAVNQVGETAASAELAVPVNKKRTDWINDTTTHESIDITWSSVASATLYNIYYSDQPASSGTAKVYLDSVSATAATPLYRDDNSVQPNVYQEAPSTDGTSGPTAGSLTLSGNRIWSTGDPAFPYRVSWSGTGQFLGSYSPYFGGGFIDLEKGGAEKPVAVKHFRDGKGTQVATVLTSNPSGGGSVWFITLTTLSVDTLQIVVPQAVKQGSIGTNAPRGVVAANNNVYYPSIKGFQSIGSAQNIINVIVTNEISANIRPSVRSLQNSASNSICGIYYYGRIYWSVPYGSSTNNQVWVLDLERQCWNIAWSIGVKQFAEYTDSTGMVHLLAIPVTGTQLIEFSSSFQGDSGAVFNTDLESGLITFDKDHTQWARVDKLYVELGKPKGNITFSISGAQKGKSVSLVKSASITDTVSTGGIGSDLVGDFQVGDSNNAPSTFAQSSVKKRLLVRKRLNNLKWTVSSSDINASYTVLEVVIKGKILPTSDPANWK